jgi:hypothetical protein
MSRVFLYLLSSCPFLVSKTSDNKDNNAGDASAGAGAKQEPMKDGALVSAQDRKRLFYFFNLGISIEPYQ